MTDQTIKLASSFCNFVPKSIKFFTVNFESTSVLFYNTVAAIPDEKINLDPCEPDLGISISSLLSNDSKLK